MKDKALFIAVWLCFIFLPNYLRADTATLAISATASIPAGAYNGSASNSTQIVIQTNVAVKILHLYESSVGNGSSWSGHGNLTIQVNGFNFVYTEASLNGAGNNMPFIIGPATLILTAQAIVSSATGLAATCKDNIICTISTNQSVQCNTNYFIPNTGVVIPADAGGPVNIILESSVDLINWIPADPGTYGTTTTNRFFRVRATR